MTISSSNSLVGKSQLLTIARKALSLCSVFVGLLVAVNVNAATTLKIATLSPEGTGWMIELRAAAKAIRERTQEEVKLKIYPGGVMGDDKCRLDDICANRCHNMFVIAKLLHRSLYGSGICMIKLSDQLSRQLSLHLI